MKTYELIFNEDKHLIDRVSIVKGGAVQADRVFFADEKDAPLYFANEEKRVIYSVAMRPNKMIFRANVSNVLGVTEPANVFYTPETVEQLQQFYFKNQNNAKTNINHEAENTAGVFPFESWIVQNEDLDKTKAIGLDAKKGDWIMGFKVENDKVWNDIKSGDLDGLSIEAYLGFKEFTNSNTNTNMSIDKNPQSLWDTMKAFFAADPTEDEKAKEAADAAAAAEAVEAAKVDAAAEVPKDEIKADAAAENVPNADTEAKDTAAPEATDIQAKYDALLEENAKLKADLTSIEAEKVKADEALVKMANETPAAAAVVDLPKEVEMSKQEAALYKFKKQHGINL
jgi:hypothetical protein